MASVAEIAESMPQHAQIETGDPVEFAKLPLREIGRLPVVSSFNGSSDEANELYADRTAIELYMRGDIGPDTVVGFQPIVAVWPEDEHRTMSERSQVLSTLSGLRKAIAARSDMSDEMHTPYYATNMADYYPRPIEIHLDEDEKDVNEFVVDFDVRLAWAYYENFLKDTEHRDVHADLMSLLVVTNPEVAKAAPDYNFSAENFLRNGKARLYETEEGQHLMATPDPLRGLDNKPRPTTIVLPRPDLDDQEHIRRMISAVRRGPRSRWH